MPSLEETIRFFRERTAPAPVPLAPELSLWQAAELTPLWRATAADLHGWDDSPYWAFPWAGGQVLARHVLDHPALVAGRLVLDFASGAGSSPSRRRGRAPPRPSRWTWTPSAGRPWRSTLS